jgi:hypothetical protein
VSSVLSVSNFLVDFGDKVVSRDPLSRVSYFLETTITNVSHSGISFSVHEEKEVVCSFDLSLQSARNPDINGPQQIFFVSPLKMDLPPGGSVKLRVTFQPQESANYSKKLSIVLKDQEESARPYFSLLCVGSGVYPCMSFSSDCLRLPPVPLGMTSKASFVIFNHGYASLEIKHRISPNVSVPLEISYPDGNQLGIMIEKIRVIVSVRSDLAISWTGKIEFYDMDGERFSLTVCGLTENCLLSNYWFVENYSSEYGFLGLDDQPVQFLPLPVIQELRQEEAKHREELRKQRSLLRQKAVESKLGITLSASDTGAKMGKNDSELSGLRGAEKLSVSSSASDTNEGKISRYTGVELDKSHYSSPEDTEARFLMKWLNSTICRRPFDVENFPNNILDNQADLVIECLEIMSGKRVSVVLPQKLVAAAGQRTGDIREDDKRTSEKSRLIASADRLLFKYQQIINFLVGSGALLNHINALWLLDKNAYLLLLEHEASKDKTVRFTPAVLALKRKLWDEQWLEFCRRSWLDVLYQAIKLFVLSRVNFKDYSVLPGIVLSTKNLPNPVVVKQKSKDSGKQKTQQPKIPKDLISSNVFTHNEQVLLAWVSYHLERADSLPDEGAASGSSSAIHNTSVGLSKKVCDLYSSFSDFFAFCQLLHSHISGITEKGEALHGYTTFDRSRMEDVFVRFDECLMQYHAAIAGLSADEVVKSGRNILLMILYLYLNLPHLVPKTKIEFSGTLGTPISKKIELKNPSKKPLMYEVSLKGSQDYSVERNQLIIPAESSLDFMVTLNARFSQCISSKVFFWNIRDPSCSQGPTLCFQCVSQIKGIQPVEKISRQACLFDFEALSVQVRNPYSRDVNVKVRMEVKFCQKFAEDFLSTGKLKKKPSPEHFREISLTKPAGDPHDISDRRDDEKGTGDDWDLENMFRQPFWINEDTLTVSKGSSKALCIYMLPFQLGKYVVQIIFNEPELGEFCYQVDAEVTLPKVGEKLAIDIVQANSSRLALSFNSKNSQFEKALSTLTESRIKNANKKIRARSVFAGILSSKSTNDEFGSSTFLLDFTNSFFGFSKKVSLVSEYAKWTSASGGKGGSTELLAHSVPLKLKKNSRNSIEIANELSDSLDVTLNSAILSFNPEKAGVYKSVAVIHPEDNPYDIRCVELCVTAKVPDMKMVIEFNGPARTRILQEIPLHNESDSDWSLIVSCSGKNFSVPKVVSVPAKLQGNFEVAFFSSLAGKFEGKLQLKNSENGDMFDFNLIGIADEPLAEDTLHFRCPARKKTAFSISLPTLETVLGNTLSHSQSSRSFIIESDLPFSLVKEKVTIPVDGGNFEFSVNSPLGGELSGSISFKDVDTGVIFWYAVVIDVTSPNEERSVTVEAVVRQAAVIDICLSNPIKDDLYFNVVISGEGLLGESTFTLNSSDLAPNSYELIYSPLVAGKSVGKISFWNELVGEVWYKLVLTALPAPSIVLPEVECMIGGEVTFVASIENPLNETIQFNLEIIDKEHFFVPGNSKLSLLPFEQSQFIIGYRPSNFQDKNSSIVKAFSKKLGEIVYEVKGKGLLPGVMPLVTVEGPLHEIVSENIIFRNSFSHPLPIEIYLTFDDQLSASSDGGVFSLLLRKSSNEIVVPAKSPFHIPVSFTPKSLGVFHATVQLRAFVNGHHLLWCYPLQGIAEMGNPIKLPRMKTPSKTSLIQEHVIPLTGLQSTKSLFVYSLSDFIITSSVDEGMRKLVNRSFKFQPLEIIDIRDSTVNQRFSSDAEVGLRVRLLFEPLRLFTSTVDISVFAKNKGKWKVVVDIEATNPEPDDIIKLSAKVGDSDRVTFKINNRFLGFSPFQAYFLTNSSPHFTVHPSSGLLPPYDTEGASFTVSFAPKEYGYIEK